MREIEFRAFDKCHNFMINDFQITSIFQSVITGEAEDACDYEVMQFTGLTDKNGVDVYESDILSVWRDDYEDEKTICVCAWISCYYPAFDIYIHSDKAKSGYESYDDEFNSFSNENIIFEVIGNIHENPELLEGEDNDK